jgi:hypothetical protein
MSCRRLPAAQVNQRSQAELNRVKLPEPEPELDPQLFVDSELSAKGPRDRRQRSTFTFVQAGRLQRQAEVQRLRVRAWRWHLVST